MLGGHGQRAAVVEHGVEVGTAHLLALTARDEEQEREFIRNTSNRENCIFIVGLIDDKIIGSLTFIASPRKRMMHRGELGIAVLKQFWGIGVGNFLMDYLFRWVNSNGIINKVDLSVREDNINAINLYMKS